MSKQKKAPEITGDDDTDAILAEMEQAGEEIPAFNDLPAEDDADEDQDAAGKKDEDEDDDSDEDEDEEEGDEPDDEDDSEDDEDDDSEEDEDDQDEDDDAEDDEEEDDDSDTDEPEDKKIPLWKRHKDLKKQLKDALKLNEDNAKAATEKTDEDIDKQLDEFAKKHKTSKEAARDLLNLAASIAAKKAGLDPELKSAIERVAKTDKQQRFWKDQEKQYAKDFKSNVGPLVKRDGKDLAKVQKRLQALAFMPENAEKSLVSIYLEQYASKQTGPKRRITSEGNRTHGRVHGKAAEDYQPEDIDSMSDEEFDEFSESLGKQSKSTIVRH